MVLNYNGSMKFVTLGIFIVNSTKFKCSVSHAKRSFYRAANGIFGKIGRLASEEVIVQLVIAS